jgi:hypothetical protein
MEPLSTISKEDFLRLNEFALGEGPAAQLNLSNLIFELALKNRSQEMAGCERGVLVVAGHTIPTSSGYIMVECILDFPLELQHPVEQASACLNLLQRLEHAEAAGRPESPRIARAEVQRRLSRLLVDYPVLLDGRVILGVSAPGSDWSTMACALAETSFASLPSPAHGLSERELRLFASRSSVKSGLMRPCPPSNSKASLLRGKTPLEIAAAAGVAPNIFGATRGAFLTSLLRLSYFARVMTGRPVLNFRATDPNAGDGLYKSLGKVFWDVATNAGALSGITPAEFADAMKLPSPFRKATADEAYDDELELTIATGGRRASDQAPDALQYQLAVSVDEGLFGVHSQSAVPKVVFVYNQEPMYERTTGAVELLVAIGSHASTESAAKWLSQVSVGVLRMWGATAGPGCSHEGAIGFLAGIDQYGAVASLAGAEDSSPPTFPTPVQQRAASVHRTWVSAISVYETHKAMKGVIDSNTAGVVPSETAARPRGLRQRV